MKIHDTATIWSGTPLRDGVPLLLIMHGFGANERDLAPLSASLPEGVATACIRAPLPIPQVPGGFAWFPITDDPGGPDHEIADFAVQAVHEWLAAALDGVTPGPLVLLGFSQGGAMVTHLLRHYPTRFAAGVVLSGFTVPGELPGDGELAGLRPPVFFGYDPSDPIVPRSAFTRTEEFGNDHFRLTTRTYEIGHGINEAELADVRAFLEGVI